MAKRSPGLRGGWYPWCTEQSGRGRESYIFEFTIYWLKSRPERPATADTHRHDQVQCCNFIVNLYLGFVVDGATGFRTCTFFFCTLGSEGFGRRYIWVGETRPPLELAAFSPRVPRKIAATPKSREQPTQTYDYALEIRPDPRRRERPLAARHSRGVSDLRERCLQGVRPRRCPAGHQGKPERCKHRFSGPNSAARTGVVGWQHRGGKLGSLPGCSSSS